MLEYKYYCVGIDNRLFMVYNVCTTRERDDMFDWKNSTIEQCAWHIAEQPASNTYSQIEYYKRKEKFDIVDKILKARALAKKYRVILKADKVKKELQEGV